MGSDHRNSDHLNGVGYRCYLKLGARYYNPTTGRFTQPDPPHTCGGYTYAGEYPANNTDPTGRDFWGTAPQIASDAYFCVGMGLLGAGVGALGGAPTGPQDAVLGEWVGAVLGCQAGIVSTGIVGTAIEDW
jgi:RHS repeat-associated protein